MAPVKQHLKENNYHIIILTSITIALIVPLFFIDPKLTGFAVFQEINLPLASGVYTGSIIDAGEEAEWDNISWTATELGEMASNQDTVLLYHLNEESWGVTDSSGNNNTGTAIGSIWHNPEGRFKGALEFNDSYLDAGNSSALMPEQMTISAWAKAKELPWKNERSSIISKGKGNSIKGYEIHIQNKTENRICLEIGKKMACSKETAEPDRWYHIAGTYDGATMSIYINGELQNSTTSSLTANNLPLYIGKRQDKEGTYFNGAMDEIAILNRALDEQEVKALYKRGILSMNLSVRNCDSPECDSSSWQTVNGSSPQTLAIPNSRYLQYKIESATENPGYQVDVHNLTIGYQLIPRQAPKGTIFGNVSGISNLSIHSTSTINASGMQEITLYNKNTPLTGFNHNFSEGNLNLTEIKINKTPDYIILNMRQNTKTIYLENNNFNNLCLKDADIENIGEMSAECAEADETDLTECLGNRAGVTIKSYSCIDNNGTIEVKNVSHSALRGTQGESPATTEQTSTGSSGGGGRSARDSSAPTKKEEAIAAPIEMENEKQPAEQEKTYESKVLLEEETTEPNVYTEKKQRITTKTKSILATIAILLLAGVSGVALLDRRRV